MLYVCQSSFFSNIGSPVQLQYSLLLWYWGFLSMHCLYVNEAAVWQFHVNFSMHHMLCTHCKTLMGMGGHWGSIATAQREYSFIFTQRSSKLNYYTQHSVASQICGVCWYNSGWSTLTAIHTWSPCSGQGACLDCTENVYICIWCGYWGLYH